MQRGDGAAAVSYTHLDVYKRQTDATAAYDRDTTAPTFKSPALLDKADIEQMLPTLNRISSWIDAIFVYVSSEAINHGVIWSGYKVVEGRSKRQFLDVKSVVAAAEKAGYTDIYKTELISLTAVSYTHLSKYNYMEKKRKVRSSMILKPLFQKVYCTLLHGLQKKNFCMIGQSISRYVKK